MSIVHPEDVRLPLTIPFVERAEVIGKCIALLIQVEDSMTEQ
jgi:hypothetical protein